MSFRTDARRLAGGVVFGVMMAMRGRLSAIVHLVISAGIGALFALLFPPRGWSITLAAGAGYGVVSWVLGPLVLMPLMLGMPLFVLGPTTAHPGQKFRVVTPWWWLGR